MNKQQALIELEAWKAMYDQCEAVSKPLRELFGDLSDEMPLYETIWLGFDFGTAQLNARLCTDEVERFNDWLSFYAFDCDMGNDPKQVTKPSGESRKITTLDDVLWCMGY